MANFDDKISTHINLVSQWFVKPKYEVEASKQPYYLGPIDLLFLKLDPIQKGLLFSSKPENVQSDFVDKLKESLAISLVHFYPLAGRFSTQELPDENAKWVYLDSTKGPGAQLIHASMDVTVSSILSSVDVPHIVRSFFDLGKKEINNEGHTRPLFSIQVTELVDGVFIGFTMNHSVADGTSQWEFINTLSEIFLQLTKYNENDSIPITISRKPVFKPYFPDGWGPVLKLPNVDGNGSVTHSNGNKDVLRERIFRFSSESISKLKTKANEECGVHNISSFQALSAIMWISITRARNLTSEEETCCGIVINARPRLGTPLTNDYFGNFFTIDQSGCKVGELLNKGLGWAAMLIHQLVVTNDVKKVLEYYQGLVKFICEGPNNSGSPFSNTNKVTIGGSTRFDTYGPQFGFGKAEIVLAGDCAKEDGKITANPGREGGGSIELEVCLKPKIMNALELDEEFMSFVTL